MANVTRVESGSAGRQLAQFAEAELVGVDFTLKLDKKWLASAEWVDLDAILLFLKSSTQFELLIDKSTQVVYH